MVRSARGDQHEPAVGARRVRRAQEGVAQDLRAGGAQQHGAPVGRGIHLAGEADRFQRARGVHEHHAFAREAPDLALEK